jgi:tetratricopeptide (TPR) repeat protein
VALDPDDALAYSRLGFIILRSDGDMAAAASHFQRALALDPTNVKVIGNTGTFMQSLGRLAEAIPLFDYVAVQDPANPVAYFNVGTINFYARRWDQAIASFRAALRLSPEFTTAHFFLGVALLLGKNDAAAALQEFEAEPADEMKLTGLAIAQRALGRTAESDAALATLTATHAQDAAYYIATVYAYRGENDRAFEWLEKAVINQNQNLFTIASEPQFERLHDDPRWLALLRRLGKAPEQLAKIQFTVKLPAETAGQ